LQSARVATAPPDPPSNGLFIGLMSGTSVDAIDAAVVHLDDGAPSLVATHSHPIADALRADIFALSRGESESLGALGRLDRVLGEAFAAAALAACETAKVAPEGIAAIGSHGQTVRHAPAETPPFTLQIGDASTIAERTGICTVADFRSRDIAAGGEGAPLVPPCHAAFFGAESEARAVVNIGGIANATLLEGKEVVGGFDCGPGNTLLDAWAQEQRGERFDASGAWAAEHRHDESLLARLRDDRFFTRSGPRSTGPEHFNLAWLKSRGIDEQPAGVVQATLAELTARAIADSLQQSQWTAQSVCICGGGARNTDLMRRLHKLLQPRGARLGTTDELGIAAEWVEAAAFAWLARQTLAGRPGNAPVVTGAAGPRVLGAIYAGSC
jgi:anhydro-N-acetylmuramic acid kinase